MKVLIACEYSGTVRDEFTKIGHDATSCDGGQNYQMKKETRGGNRNGSGRPKSEPTKILTFRVKVKDAEKLRAKIKALLKK